MFRKRKKEIDQQLLIQKQKEIISLKCEIDHLKDDLRNAQNDPYPNAAKFFALFEELRKRGYEASSIICDKGTRNLFLQIQSENIPYQGMTPFTKKLTFAGVPLKTRDDIIGWYLTKKRGDD